MSNLRRRICVFCASGGGPKPYYRAAEELGSLFALRQVELVYGAGKVGLMGSLADACLQAGGCVTGVIPRFMVERGWQHQGLTRVFVESSMAVRKEKMRQLAQAVIVLPGGCGTMEELFETITARQMGHFPHPIVLLNTLGYYDELRRWLVRAETEGFMREGPARMVEFAQTPEEALRLALELPDDELAPDTIL